MAAANFNEAIAQTASDILADVALTALFPIKVGDEPTIVQFHDQDIIFNGGNTEAAIDTTTSDEPIAGVWEANMAVTSLVLEGSRRLVAVAVDPEMLLTSIEEHMGSIAAASYMLGRLDQINDSEGNNIPRFVHARDLRAMLKTAEGSEAGFGMSDTEPYLTVINSARGINSTQEPVQLLNQGEEQQ